MKVSVSAVVSNIELNSSLEYKLKSKALYEISLLVNDKDESDKSKYIFKFLSVLIRGLIGEIVPSEALVILITLGAGFIES